MVEELLGPLPAGWEYTTLGEACTGAGGDIQTGPFGSQLHASDYVLDGIPSIMPTNIGDNRVLEDGIARITPQDAERLQRYRVRTGDIIYSRRGDVEKRALVGQREDGWLCGTGCLRVRVGAGVMPAYAAYYLGHELVRGWITRHAHGATMPNLNTAILSELPFAVPPLDEQRAIAHVLGTLDDKIELNRRMNETLEAMARALFRSWFVDFEPVRAKMEGRWRPGESLPGLPAHLHPLFPDRLVPSEFGDIPEGWKVLRAGEAVEVSGGSTPSTKEPSYWDGDHSFATPKDLSLLQAPVLASTARHLTDAGVSRIRSGLLPPGTLLLSSRAPIGYLAITETPVAINQGIIAMVCDGPVGAPYALNWTRANMDAIEARASGTTFAEISKSSFRELPFLAPPRPVHAAYEEIAAPLHERVSAIARRSRDISALRDTLLSPLVAGLLAPLANSLDPGAS